jgi:hypothetical protein
MMALDGFCALIGKATYGGNLLVLRDWQRGLSKAIGARLIPGNDHSLQP